MISNAAIELEVPLSKPTNAYVLPAIVATVRFSGSEPLSSERVSSYTPAVIAARSMRSPLSQIIFPNESAIVIERAPKANFCS